MIVVSGQGKSGGVRSSGGEDAREKEPHYMPFFYHLFFGTYDNIVYLNK